MSRKGFMLLTALPPTVGHMYLINFAQQYCLAADIRHLVVLVCGQKHEPISSELRANLIKLQLTSQKSIGIVVEVLHITKTMPQEPEDHPNFWEKWKMLIKSVCTINTDDIIFASELYGHTLAEIFECQFVNCNVYRQIMNTSASRIRENPIEYFPDIITEAQRLFKKTITIFGPESVGKTTMTKKLAAAMNGYFVPEWAREYLEIQASPETTLERMQTIVYGQWATQETVFKLVDKPFIFQDTDLLSTAGFYKLYGWDASPAMKYFIRADHYLLLTDEVPFVQDKLRYGGDKREADWLYWKGVLDEAKVPYTIISGASYADRLAKAIAVSLKVFKDHPLWSYRRHKDGYNKYVGN